MLQEPLQRQLPEEGWWDSLLCRQSQAASPISRLCSSWVFVMPAAHVASPSSVLGWAVAGSSRLRLELRTSECACLGILGSFEPALVGSCHSFLKRKHEPAQLEPDQEELAKLEKETHTDKQQSESQGSCRSRLQQDC